jgi:hypothetical protein
MPEPSVSSIAIYQLRVGVGIGVGVGVGVDVGMCKLCVSAFPDADSMNEKAANHFKV